MAAATASMNDDRTALSSRVRSAAAVVPPGEVTASAELGGLLPGLGHHPGGAEHGLHHQPAADLAGQAGGHPRLDHRLGDQEDVGRPRSGDAGHRVEVALGQPDHAFPPIRGSPRPSRDRPAFAALPPDMAATPAPISAGVLGMALTTTAPDPRAASRRADERPATIESTRAIPTAARVPSTASATSGLTANRAASAGTGPRPPQGRDGLRGESGDGPGRDRSPPDPPPGPIRRRSAR